MIPRLFALPGGLWNSTAWLDRGVALFAAMIATGGLFLCPGNKVMAQPAPDTTPTLVSSATPALKELIADCFDGQRAFADLVRQCDFGARVPGSPAHDETRRWIVRRLESLGWKVREQRFRGTPRLIGTSVEMTNIIATLGEGRPRRILLGAHWDTRPLADLDPVEPHPFLGANDGASGVAVLLELARCLPLMPPRNLEITLAFYDGEDSGHSSSPYGRDRDDPTYMGFCLGSRHFAATLPRDRYPEAAITIDMIGKRNLRIYPERHGVQRARALTEEFFTLAMRHYPSVFSTERSIILVDDHLPLLERGVQSIVIIDFNYEQWHRRDDLPEACDPQSLKIIGKTLLTWIKNSDMKPAEKP